MRACRLRWGATVVVLVACNAPPPPREEPAAAVEPAAQPSTPPAQAPSPTPVKTAEPEPPSAAQPAAAPERELDPRLLDPKLANETAPERFTVTLQTTRGELHIDVRRSWAPRGADRVYNLVRAGYFDDTAFFRVIDGFIAQVGISGVPAVNRAWRGAPIEDDPVAQGNARGTVSFAAAGKNTRTTQIFINLADNPQLDAMGFAPFGRVRELDLAQKLYAAYGEGAPSGRGPLQARIQREGNAYLKGSFPELDYIQHATISDEKGARPAKP
jgi:peptidyl-prolyl cis-trans isomerase A (cyclophilin A)